MRQAVLCLAFVLCACGSAVPLSSRGPSHATTAHAARAGASAVMQAPNAHAIARAAVRAAVADGLGVLLQRIDLDDQPVMAGGKFHGFRIAALRGPAFWSGVDLEPGDVVTSVNGMPIERPEQAQKAFESLESASALRVAYERDGHARELVFAIVDDR